MKTINNNDVLLVLNIVKDNLQGSKKILSRILKNNYASRNSLEYKRIDNLETLLMRFEDRVISELEYFSKENMKY